MTNTYAEYKLRLVAYLLDCVIGFMLICGLLYIVAIQPTSQATVTAAIISLIVIINPIFMYNSVLFIYYFNATPGKLILGLRVVSDLQQKLTFKQILFRQTLGYMFSSTFFGLGYFSVIKDERKQAWHDKAAATIVTKKGNTFVIGLMLLILSLALTFSLLFNIVQKFSQGPFVKEYTKNEQLEQEREKMRKEQIKNEESIIPADFDYEIEPI